MARTGSIRIDIVGRMGDAIEAAMAAVAMSEAAKAATYWHGRFEAERDAHTTTRQLGNIHCLEQDARIGDLEQRADAEAMSADCWRECARGAVARGEAAELAAKAEREDADRWHERAMAAEHRADVAEQAAERLDERAQAWFEQAERLAIELADTERKLADAHEELRAVRSLLDAELQARREADHKCAVAEYLLELRRALDGLAREQGMALGVDLGKRVPYEVIR